MGDAGKSAPGRISHDLCVVVLIGEVVHAPRQHLVVKVESMAFLDGWPNNGRAPSSQPQALRLSSLRLFYSWMAPCVQHITS